MQKAFSILLFMLLLGVPIFAQPVSNDQIKTLIQSYKSDIRGPYKEIRWFCPDGSTVPAKERCAELGGVQRAVYKNAVTDLGISNHIFFGQILASTPFLLFWDADFQQSRLKQYQIEKYLRSIDNGWILQKAQYYRGAFQAEDEERWGIGFFKWMLSNDTLLQKHYFLIRQAARDIPHGEDNNLKQRIRSNSKLISESYAPFTNARIKIHGQPDASDLEMVQAFKSNNATKMSVEDQAKLQELITDLKTLYKAFDIASLSVQMQKMSKQSELYRALLSFQNQYNEQDDASKKTASISSLLLELRSSITTLASPEERLAAIDISILLEDLLFQIQTAYHSSTIKDMGINLYQMGKAAAGCGYLELWEWEQLSGRLTMPSNGKMDLVMLTSFMEASRNIVEWGTGMYMACYDDVVTQFNAFEDKSAGFVDDKIRSSLLLLVGQSVNQLGDQIAVQYPVNHQIMGLKDKNSVRGINPGIAKGELVVMAAPTEHMVFDKNKIYIFHKPPSDLKPVAGIATVTEGNLVSHVQLLARSLGIPNAVLSLQNLEALKQYSGQQVFYAVSSKGIVVLKPATEMTSPEKALFELKKRAETKIKVPVEKIKLSYNTVLNLREVNATFSGEVCGPKAANMGQLKQMFPNHVVEGLVLPFGIFKAHLDQKMPNADISYWQHLNFQFEHAAQMKQDGKSEAEIETFMLSELDKFRKAIVQIKLSDAFIADLNAMFKSVFGVEMGNIPVFLRSDTNMEDLKDFSGAGLNLTLFNVVSADAILQGIREVWASPYTERSYKWRQRYLLNPENVFPSILIIPSVDVDYSGVVVTKGVHSGSANEITIAFSRGAGGAVDGQVAETYVLKPNNKAVLISPAREPDYKTLPVSGGTKKEYSTFEKPILNAENMAQIREIVATVKNTFPSEATVNSPIPYDLEMGFKNNKLWLFQVRPFVENKHAAGSSYLESLNASLNQFKWIDINQALFLTSPESGK